MTSAWLLTWLASWGNSWGLAGGGTTERDGIVDVVIITDITTIT